MSTPTLSKDLLLYIVYENEYVSEIKKQKKNKSNILCSVFIYKKFVFVMKGKELNFLLVNSLFLYYIQGNLSFVKGIRLYIRLLWYIKF